MLVAAVSLNHSILQSDATQIDDPEVTSLVGEENEIFKSAVKLIRVEVTVPPGYLGNISVEFVNDGLVRHLIVSEVRSSLGS